MSSLDPEVERIISMLTWWLGSRLNEGGGGHEPNAILGRRQRITTANCR